MYFVRKQFVCKANAIEFNHNKLIKLSAPGFIIILFCLIALQNQNKVDRMRAISNQYRTRARVSSQTLALGNSNNERRQKTEGEDMQKREHGNK